jgi:GMP synthase (glutamine-hydrolysing)
VNVLIIDNNIDEDSWGSNDLRHRVAQIAGVTVHVRRAPHDDLPRSIKNYDKLIISGSKTSCMEEAPWISRLDHLTRDAIDRSISILGVCYGHQTLNRVLGSREILGMAPVPEFGWTEIELIQKNPLFEGLPNKFYSYSSHYEMVRELPKGMNNLARSKDCPIQACQLENRPVWGIQFHPERGLEKAERTLKKRLADGLRHGLLHPLDGANYYNPKVGELIFANFLKS